MSELDRNLTILAVAVAGIIQVSVTEGPFTFWNLMTGVIMGCVLATYRLSQGMSLRESFALAAVWGLVIVIGSGVLIQCLFPAWPRTSNGEIRSEYYLGLWFAFSMVALLVILVKSGGVDRRQR